MKKESSAILPANAIGKGRLSKRSLFSVAIALLLMPLTLWFGETFLQGKKYYFISLLLLFEMMLPFFLIYEGRKPKAREIVIVASLCAIAVAGRLAFFMLPQFKPVMAVVIVSGIVFGGETGFLVGAVSMFASNLFFSQGVWTPWQMVAMGLIGLLAGLVFRRNTSVPPKGGMMLFGFLAAIAVYGGMMNFSSAVIWSVDINWKTVFPYYATGFPFDVVHGIATAFFLWIGGEAMIEKLERIKYKYGLM
ncbi:MAG: ECF transporter S component [Bacillota bacterium]|nr:ECF transporter S component [Bacillota bacterium]